MSGGLGRALLCSEIVYGSRSVYAIAELDAADQDAISGRVELANVLGGAFGVSDSESRFEAISS